MRNSNQAKALIGAAVVVVLMVIAGYFLQSSLQTAEIAEPEPTDTVQDLPAGRATGNEQPTGAVEN
ncbi:hypothetical protein REJC140_00721 [Pseudorhizobium endolithicum]|uniref:Uncharacterized protein n=1 Tax=Pseudorhizobium endolithicum TaxID=1191678 RepID=A0ABN7JRH9_9HYPH|nr:hypothetical protein [Pseudorhizobium endolithicum]CAD6406699.1 hypothetical protein REQ54_00178 [Rhizobium sp. Q54]CAD7039187.1 hypothetical protein REJC140_00721 [Pseudorhizobium endolithicum]